MKRWALAEAEYHFEQIPDSHIMWVAGLLEGEGSFSHHGNNVRVRIEMGDRDVIEQYQRILGIEDYAITVREDTRSPNRKPMYGTNVNGHRAPALMQRIHVYMGQRRRARIQRLLQQYYGREQYERKS